MGSSIAVSPWVKQYSVITSTTEVKCVTDKIEGVGFAKGASIGDTRISLWGVSNERVIQMGLGIEMILLWSLSALLLRNEEKNTGIKRIITYCA